MGRSLECKLGWRQKLERLRSAIPGPFEMKEVRAKHRDAAHSSLSLLMLNEMERLNVVLVAAGSDLEILQKAMSGEIVRCQHPELLNVARSIERDRVPAAWQRLLSRSRSQSMSRSESESVALSSWMESVRLRCDQLSRWSSYGKPKVFWLSGFHFVSRFVMALKQSMAKRQSVAIQQIEFEFNVINNAQDSTGKTLQMPLNRAPMSTGSIFAAPPGTATKARSATPSQQTSRPIT